MTSSCIEIKKRLANLSAAKRSEHGMFNVDRPGGCRKPMSPTLISILNHAVGFDKIWTPEPAILMMQIGSRISPP
jgi:hypothetical protein